MVSRHMKIAPKNVFPAESYIQSLHVNCLMAKYVWRISSQRRLIKYLPLCIQPPAAVHRLQNGATINNCSRGFNKTRIRTSFIFSK